MNFFKTWFGRVSGKPTPNKPTEAPPLSNKVKDISEPVISFLKVFENNPKRFKIVSTLSAGWFNIESWTFTDTSNLESWRFTRRLDYYGGHEYLLPNFLTKAEESLIVERLESYYLGRKERLKELRKQRTINRERDRLTKIYQEVLCYQHI